MAEKHDAIPSNQDQGFIVGSRFCDLRPLGFGGGGTIFSAVDSECDKSVAIKKISLSNQKRCQLALREVRILRKLQHENIVKIYDILHPDFDSEEAHPKADCSETVNSTSLYLVQELLDTDLHNVIKSGILSKEHTRLFMYQLLRGLKYLHSSNVLHRDLKPDNLLINLEDLVLKIGDFGMARILDPDYCHKGNLTQNVGTSWYRSPELLLHPSNYTKAIDLWAAGCVFAEMLLGKPLFPADHDLEHMMLILEFIPLQEDDLNDILSSLPSKMLKNYKGTPRRPLSQIMPDADPFALDLLQEMLTFNPSERITAEDAISHPYLNVYSCSLDEPLNDNPFHIESEVDNLSPPTLRRMIFDESQARSQGDHIESDNICVEEEMDESDDYRLKLELLGISLRDNSDLESDNEDEEEKLDFVNFEKDFEKYSDNATEKSESETSEKSDEEIKEMKLSLWEQDKLASRRSSNEIDDLNTDQEKGVIESDSEGSEKSETEDIKSEKNEKLSLDVKSVLEKNVASEVATDGGRSPSPKDKMNKNEALKRQCNEGDRENKLDNFNRDRSMDCPEKANDDKFEKEKSEKMSSQDDVEKSETESVQIELQDKIAYSDDDDTTTSEISNKLSYSDSEKTLEDCLLSRRSKQQRQDNSGTILSENTSNQCGEIKLTKSVPQPTSQETLDLSSIQVPNLKNTSSSSVQGSTSSSSLVGSIQDASKSNTGEMLYVEIPKPSPLPSSTCSPKSTLQAVASHHSPRPRASLSPREKSVRPKKQDWFYKYKSGLS